MTTVNSKSIATMKNLFTRLMLVAVAAMGIVACQTEPEIYVPENNADAVSVSITAGFDDTRSAFDELADGATTYTSSWTANETVRFSLNQTGFVDMENTAEGKSATFNVSFTEGIQDEGSIYAFSPKGIYSSTTKVGGFTGSMAQTYTSVYVVVPSEQTPQTNSCDEGVHLLTAKYDYKGGVPTTIDNMPFKHLLAYGKMEIKGFEGTIKSVKLTADTPLSGNSVKYFFTAEEPYIEGADNNTLVLDATNVQNNVFWFGCIPAVLDNTTLTVVVTDTEENTYTKEIDLTGKNLAFKQGRVSNFAVSFKDIAVDEIVDDTVNIPNGQYAIIAFNANKTVYSAMTTTLTSTSTVRMSSVDVVFDVNAESGFTTADSSLVWNITNVDGGFTFTNNEGKYLSWINGGNSAEFDSEENVLTITKSEAEEGTYNVALKGTPDRYLQKNTSGQYFAFYTNTSNQRMDLYIVPVTIVEDTTPSLSVNQDSVELPYTESTGNIDVTIKNLSVDDIDVDYSADWLIVQLTTDGLNYKATANEGEERYATVTLSAVGIDEIKINFTQAEKPEEVTGDWTLVEDASTLAVDDQVVIVAVDHDYALSTTQNSNNRGQVAVTRSGKTVTINANVQILTLETGAVDGTFALNTGSGYLYAASSSKNYLRTEETLSANSSWTITIDAAGVATIIAKGANTRNCMQYNYSSSLFACYSSASQKDIAIYKLTE